MQERLTDLSCNAFADVLASKASVPGGGGAAALVGALGVALCSMVGNFTTGKKKYAAYEEDVQAMLKKGEALRQQLLSLVEADAEAFAPLAKAYSIPKDDPTRNEVLEAATWNACQAPAEMVRRCAEAIALLEEMLVKGSVMLVSDVGCGAHLTLAAMESAAMNVFINTGSLLDREKAEAMNAEMNAILADCRLRAGKVIESVNLKIKGGN